MRNENKRLIDDSLRLKIKSLEAKIADAAISGNFEKIKKINDQINFAEEEIKTQEQLTLNEKSTRFTRPKNAGVRQNNPVMGYAKPTEQRKISHKYHCIVSGEKRMNPCGGCSNPKGCLSNSMQYKEQDK